MKRTLTLNEEQVDALRRLVEYNWDETEDGIEDTPNHIGHDVIALDKALEQTNQ